MGKRSVLEPQRPRIRKAKYLKDIWRTNILSKQRLLYMDIVNGSSKYL